MADFDGGNGADTYTGGGAGDAINGNGGDDILSGGGGSDTISGGTGADRIDGGGGDDTLYSAGVSTPWESPYSGLDYIAPILDTLANRDTLTGGDGSDTIYAGYGDAIDGGSGSDALLISFVGATSGVTADFEDLQPRGGTMTVGGATIAGIERILWIEGSEFADTLHAGGSEGSFAPMFGRGGDDALYAGYYTGNIYGDDGNDLIDRRGSGYSFASVGGAGNDTIFSGGGFGRAYGDAGDDVITGSVTALGGDGNDTLVAEYSSYRPGYFGEAGDDTITGASDITIAIGGIGADTLTGNDGDDWLYAGGSAGPDVLYYYNSYYYLDRITFDLGAERDTVDGGSGNDFISAGYGDIVAGGDGQDTLGLSLAGGTTGVTLKFSDLIGPGPFALAGGSISGFESVAFVEGTASDDRIDAKGTTGGALIFGGEGDDVLSGADFRVVLNGGDGDDVLTGSRVNDTIDGGSGADRIFAGAGDDTIAIAPSEVAEADVFVGGAGFDTISVSYSNSFTDLSAATFSGIERINASFMEVRMTIAGFASVGSVQASTIRMTDGGALSLARVHVQGELYLADVANTVSLAKLAEGSYLPVFGGSARDVVTGSASNDTLHGRGSGDVLRGGAGDDGLFGDDGDDQLNGGAGADYLGGGAGDDVLDGGAGADQFSGGEGNDTYILDTVGEQISESGDGIDTVVASFDYTLGYDLENLRLAGGGRVGIGNYLANRIDGSAGADTLDGGSGDDRLLGGGGRDTLIGGEGIDTLSGGADRDTLTGGTGADTFRFANGEVGRTLAEADRITDFSQAEGDQINLSGLDAIAGTAAVDRFAFIGTAAFSGRAGEIHYAFVGNSTIVSADTDGDAVGDVFLRLDGRTALTALDLGLPGGGAALAPAGAAEDASALPWIAVDRAFHPGIVSDLIL